MVRLYQVDALLELFMTFVRVTAMNHGRHLTQSWLLLQVWTDDTHSLQTTRWSRHKRLILALIRQVDAKVQIDTT